MRTLSNKTLCFIFSTIVFFLFSFSLGVSFKIRTFLNINIPEGQPGEYRFTRQGSRRVTSGIAEKTDLRGRPYYWIGADQSQWIVAPDSDYEAILGGRISITPMHLVQTDYQTLADLQQLELGVLDWLESSK